MIRDRVVPVLRQGHQMVPAGSIVTSLWSILRHVTTFQGPDAFYAILGNLRDAITVQLRNTVGGAPSRVAIVPGAIAWDECDTCGMLALAVNRYYITDSFPVQVTTTQLGHGTVLAADVSIQMIRCAPVPQSNDVAPSVIALDASAREVGEDAFVVLCSTKAALDELELSGQILHFMIRQQTMAGPEGACVGSELSVAIGIQW